MNDAFLKKIDEPRIIEAIRAAELRSRGEIRVHVTQDEVSDVMKAAAAAFEKIGMTATGEHNGVLIFIAPRAQKFAVLGDSGITSLVGVKTWDEVAAVVGASFREGRFTEGVVAAVERAGALLCEHFPRVAGDAGRDELSNEISRG